MMCVVHAGCSCIFKKQTHLFLPTVPNLIIYLSTKNSRQEKFDRHDDCLQKYIKLLAQQEKKKKKSVNHLEPSGI